jgi:hypothetical protein
MTRAQISATIPATADAVRKAQKPRAVAAIPMCCMTVPFTFDWCQPYRCAWEPFWMHAKVRTAVPEREYICSAGNCVRPSNSPGRHRIGCYARRQTGLGRKRMVFIAAVLVFVIVVGLIDAGLPWPDPKRRP